MNTSLIKVYELDYLSVRQKKKKTHKKKIPHRNKKNKKNKKNSGGVLVV